MAEAIPDERTAGEAGDRPSARRSLVGTVCSALRDEILGGQRVAGEKLPSEAGLTERFGVSRTVVREAIASLRADGLVEARHGVGVFVLNTQPAGMTLFHAVDTARISSTIELLELRAAVEIEAAGLAAARRSPAQEEVIFERFDDLSALVAAGQPTTDADFAFHLAVADASNNPRFREFLEMMGRNVIPRTSLQKGQKESTGAGYLEQIQNEHRRIAEAISTRDEDGAREAVRTHLKGSLQRYRNMIRRV